MLDRRTRKKFHPEWIFIVFERRTPFPLWNFLTRIVDPLSPHDFFYKREITLVCGDVTLLSPLRPRSQLYSLTIYNPVYSFFSFRRSGLSLEIRYFFVRRQSPTTR